jgi:phosphomannomutase
MSSAKNKSKYQKRYVRFLAKHLAPAKPLRIIFDSSDGTTGPILKQLMTNHRQRATDNKQLTTRLLNGRPDGRFPAHGPDPWKPGAMKTLKKEIKKRKADLGIIFDADGDRVFFLDDKARILEPGVATLLLSGKTKNSILIDARMGFLVREVMKKRKIKVVNSRVGHSFIKQTMRARKISFGAEVSGHYYFKKFFYSDSGIFAAIQCLNAVSHLKTPLSLWVNSLPRYFNSGEINFKVKNQERIIKKITAQFKNRSRKFSELDGVKMEFETQKGRWWFIARSSNTQNLLRLIVEADNKKLLQEKLQSLVRIIKSSEQ